MEKERFNHDDVEFAENVLSFLGKVRAEASEFCMDCPYYCYCQEFEGACAVQTVRSVAKWGVRVMEQVVVRAKRKSTRFGHSDIKNGKQKNFF